MLRITRFFAIIISPDNPIKVTEHVLCLRTPPLPFSPANLKPVEHKKFQMKTK
jgi:hypothetical protein